MKILLRPIKVDDLERMAELANDAEIAANLTDAFAHPYKIEHARTYFRRVNPEGPHCVLAIEVDGKYAGNIGLHLQEDIMRKNAEMGYWLGRPYWGKGIMTEAVKKMVEHGFGKFDFTRIFARPFGHNIGSQRVLEKAGFKLEARLSKTIYKLGRYEDELIYAIRKEEKSS